MKNYLFSITIVLLLSCTGKPTHKGSSAIPLDTVAIKYAKGFSIEKYKDFKLLKVHSLKDTTLSYTYLLTDSLTGHKALRNIAYDYKIKTPLKKVVVTSTTHLPPLVSLDVENTIVGFPHLDFVSSPEVRKRIEAHKIAELGENENLNFEVLISLQPDALIGFSIGSDDNYTTLSRIGIPILYNMDWEENNPLGKAEWIKFFGALYDQTDKAEKIFNTIEKEYNTAKETIPKDIKRPTVLSGALFKDVWYVPGGKSWVAQFIQDAGGDYLYKDVPKTGSLSLSFESVFNKGKNADYWINPGDYTKYKQLLNSSEHYAEFKAFKKGKIYTYAGRQGETGGITYFEKGPSRPDLILKDLIHIFHPELLPDHYKSAFYQPLR